MKKLISLVVLCCYLGATTGITFCIHYCGGSFKSVNFFGNAEKDCCDEKENDGCCSNKVVTAKCKEQHRCTVADIFNTPLEFVLPPTIHTYFTFAEPSCFTKLVNITHFPRPILDDPPIYLLVRNLRI